MIPQQQCPECDGDDFVTELLTLYTAEIVIRSLRCSICDRLWFVREPGRPV